MTLWLDSNLKKETPGGSFSRPAFTLSVKFLEQALVLAVLALVA
jgi:hypothetical protein